MRLALAPVALLLCFSTAALAQEERPMKLATPTAIAEPSGEATRHEATEEPGAGPAHEHDGPEAATIGVYISDIREIDLKKGTFAATLYYWIRHPTKDDPKEQKDCEEVDFTNGKVEHLDEQDRKDDGGVTYAAWKAEGHFYFFPELRKYPFDAQKIAIHFENPALEVDSLVYKDDRASYARSGQPERLWGLGKGVTIPEYDITGVERAVGSSLYETDFGDPQKKDPSSTYSSYVVTVTLQRKFQPFLFKILLPLLVILAMAYLVFWLPPHEIHPAAELAITALLSCFAFNVAVSLTLPQIGYLVISDKFFIWTYFLLFSNLAISVLLFNMDHHGHPHRAEKGAKACRVAFPCLYAAGFAYLVLGGLGG